MLVYNLVRQVMLKAAQRQGVEPERISFFDALRWLCGAQIAQVLAALLINPLRPDQVEPRMLKRRKKQYKLMNKPRHVLRQTVMNSEVTD